MTTYERRGVELGQKIGEALRLAEMWRGVAQNFERLVRRWPRGTPLPYTIERGAAEAAAWMEVWLDAAEDLARADKRAIPHLVVR